MDFMRASGVLLHPTSLPGPNGIGELGPEAYAWVDWLAGAGCGLWQVLPLGPTSYGDSPYQCFSAFAGNPYLISFDRLLKDGLLLAEDLQDRPIFEPDRVDFGTIYLWKLAVLDRAYGRFRTGPFSSLRKAVERFSAENGHWLPDYALFMAIKDAQGGLPWWEWPAGLKLRSDADLAEARKVFAESIESHILRQYLFHVHWQDLRSYAHSRGVRIVGDIPIFVAYDSSDVWANPELFYLDDQGRRIVQAGVPPDYFSATGQLWGNPLYRWEAHGETGYAWWFERLRSVLSQVDILRLDHFRGFYDYWEIPGEAKTAQTGRWVPGPGAVFFDRLKESLGDLPIIAEDLGALHPEVYELRDRFNLPGMKILVFAFGDEHPNIFIPYNYTANSVVYTGTHDNDTALGWYRRVGEKERDLARRYLARDGRDISWDLVREAWSSVSMFALAPLQDLLGLGNEARMNLPGTVGTHNWSWRVRRKAVSPELQARLSEANFLYGRLKG
ncbi:MAG TPA: 4-alpha-glucanotransferase [Anaerolineales bacterium]|nr:4-alpha-glucanotransferase [Anaerolineales bacterium]